MREVLVRAPLVRLDATRAEREQASHRARRVGVAHVGAVLVVLRDVRVAARGVRREARLGGEADGAVRPPGTFRSAREGRALGVRRVRHRGRGGVVVQSRALAALGDARAAQMPKPHGHLRERVAPHRREVLVKHSLRRAPLEPVPPDAVREPELLVRARVPQRRGLAEQTQRLRVVLLDALAGLVRAAEARHRLAVARLERQDLAQGAHGVRLAPRKTRGRAFQRVPRGAELRLRGGKGRTLLRRREPRVGIARSTRRGRIVVVQEQTLLAELVLRRLQRARRVARAGRREQQQERRRKREAHRMPRPPHAPSAQFSDPDVST